MKAQGQGINRGQLVFLVLSGVALWAKSHPMRRPFLDKILN